MELLITHISFLSLLLDKKKDLLGLYLYTWTLHACNYFGVSRYILPSPLVKKVDRATGKSSETIGPPLRRPPPGWDVRSPRGGFCYSHSLSPLFNL
jgi:hypothetical protein